MNAFTIPDVSVSASAPGAPRRDEETWAAAKKLQTAFFQDLLKHGGFGEAFSTGSGPLDSFTSVVLERVAEDMTRREPSLAEHFYRQLQKREEG